LISSQFNWISCFEYYGLLQIYLNILHLKSGQRNSFIARVSFGLPGRVLKFQTLLQNSEL